MDKRFYNIEKKKKKARYVRVSGTGSSDYNNALYYISEIIFQLLEGQFYLQQMNNRLLLEEISEMNWANTEYYYFINLINQITEINLSKLIENNQKSWNLVKLLKNVRHLDWKEIKQLETDVETLTEILKGTTISRHTRGAHTSKSNKPNLLFTNAHGNKENILKAVGLVDKFVDGEILYELDINDKESINLRKYFEQY